jgi:spore maturation protein CgeB
LDRQGHNTRIDCIDCWHCPESFGDDVVIVLRGLSQYEPRPDHINLVWQISHPDRVANEELEGFDHVFVASRQHAEALRTELSVPTSVLLQCTDPEVFSPPDASGSEADSVSVGTEGIVLVGNSRDKFRKIVRDCLEAEVDFHVVGTRWEHIVDEDRILGQHIPNEELAGFYSRCEIVLNDHWDTMREHGFLSNRLFDAAACGAQILTDRVDGLEEVFGDVLLTYEDPEELARVSQSARATLFSERSRRIELAERIRREHSFEVRVRDILHVVQSLDSLKRLGHDRPENGGGTDPAVNPAVS